MNYNLLRELADKVERNEATFDDYKAVVEVQTRMLIEQCEIAARAITVAEKLSHQNDKLVEANNRLAWLADPVLEAQTGTA